MSMIFYHHPRCTKSHSALKLLEQRGVSVHVVEYLKTPPTIDELDRILHRLDCEPRELMRKKEAAYRDVGADKPELSRRELIQRMHQHPILIERPILVSAERAAVGRPPENILSLL